MRYIFIGMGSLSIDENGMLFRDCGDAYVLRTLSESQVHEE